MNNLTQQLLGFNPYEARRHRRVVERKIGEPFYRQQDRMQEGWALGEASPEGLVLGQIPTSGSIGNSIVGSAYDEERISALLMGG